MATIRGAFRVAKRLLYISRDYARTQHILEALTQRNWVLEQQLLHLRDQVDLLKSSLEVSPVERSAMAAKRAQRVVGPRPLVSVNIATYNRADILVERSLPSILRQTYDNLEINVVGDCCTDDTARRMREIRDPRVRFVNLPKRGDYPSEPTRRWMVAGTAALNHALSMSTGDFVTHLDDDDEHLPDRVEKLLLFSLSNDCDFVWHPFLLEDKQGNWSVSQAPSLDLASVTTSAMFYRSWLKSIAWNVESHWLGEPGDWNRIRRMKLMGPKAMRFPEVLLRHYRERNRAEYKTRAAA